MIAKIVVKRPIKNCFDYRIPLSLNNRIKLGQRVKVNFRGSLLTGYVIGLAKQSKLKKLRNLESLVDDEPIFDSHMLRFARRISDYYLCAWGEVLDMAVPLGLKKITIKKDETSKEASFKQTYIKQTYKNIIDKILRDKFKVYLHHALDEEDRLDLYLQLINRVLQKGKKVIILSPGILSVNLLKKDLDKYYSRSVVIYHSRLRIRQKREVLKRIVNNEAQIVIGSRSVAFAPLKNIGLVIVDEEESQLYKKPDAPKINAKKLAQIRAQMLNCPVLLSSLTPSCESYYKAKKQEYILIRQNRRRYPVLKNIEIVDLRKEKDIYGRKGYLSYFLRDRIDESLKNNKKVILFLNRRGFATFIKCKKCGYVLKCKRCNKTLIYHYDKKKLICHFCNYQEKPPKICPKCKSAYLSYVGFGTEKLESVLYHKYPHSSIGRLDADILSEKGRGYKILSEFNSGKIDILVGTQILFKGVNFTNTGFIGVVSADTSIHMPDFRAQEKTFSTLYRIINQSSSQNENIKIVIQTYLPYHFAIVSACKYDYQEFYKKEIKQRRSLNLPPYYHFNSIILRSLDKDKLIRKTEELYSIIKKQKKGMRRTKINAPQTLNISKIRGNFRQKIIIKTKDLETLRKIITKSMKQFKQSQDVIVVLDIDALEYF